MPILRRDTISLILIAARVSSRLPRYMLPPHSIILPMRRTRVVLSTCHLDYDPQNNAPGNLAALC